MQAKMAQGKQMRVGAREGFAYHSKTGITGDIFQMGSITSQKLTGRDSEKSAGPLGYGNEMLFIIIFFTG
jgi:hypothetical protein